MSGLLVEIIFAIPAITSIHLLLPFQRINFSFEQGFLIKESRHTTCRFHVQHAVLHSQCAASNR